MTEPDAATDRSSLVPGAHRLVRAVDDKEGPLAGALITYEDSVAVRIDVGELDGWGGWAFSDTEHICGVIDVHRRVDGHDALVPWCTQRVEAFLGRRLAAEVQLAPGELTTLVASLLRGVRELGAAAGDAVGEWWLTGDGRPLFVHGDGGSVRARTAALIERIAGHSTDRATVRVLEEIAVALREHRHHADEDARWEGQLFEVAAPRALRLDVFAPEKASDLAPRRSLRLEAREGRVTRRDRARVKPEKRAVRSVIAAVRAEVRERSRALHARLKRSEHDGGSAASRRREPRPAGTRRRPLILAGSLAAVVLIVGLMWPDGQEPESADAAEGVRDSAMIATEDSALTDADADADEDQSEESAKPAPVSDEDVLLAVPVLLAAVEACVSSGSETCPSALAEGLPTPVDGLVSGGADASSSSLVDDYGDVAVIKLVPAEQKTDSADQMLVLQRQQKKWLVRDVYDVAHQPG